MTKKKVCFLAQFPPPIHGLSKAVDTLYNSHLSKEFEFEKIDLTDNKRLLKNLMLIWKSKADLFYFTISQTKGGNLRDLIILKLLEIQKKKCLVHLHGGYYRALVDNDMSEWQRKMNYKVIQRLEGVIVLSDSLKSIFQGMISDERIHVVPNCVDDEFLMSDDEFEQKLKILRNKEILHVLYLSNFIKLKGYPEVLEMARVEKERCELGGKKRFHFDFAGKFFQETERNFFFGFIKEHGLDEFITYHGIVDGYRKRKLLKECDIFMLLTRYPNEGQPISILEAMSNGMMIVTTNHSGIPDIVQDSVNGIVVKEQICDIVILYDKIKNIDMESIAQINHFECSAKYQQSSYIERLKRVFEGSLS